MFKEIYKEDVNSIIVDYWYQIIVFVCDDWNK